MGTIVREVVASERRKRGASMTHSEMLREVPARAGSGREAQEIWVREVLESKCE